MMETGRRACVLLSVLILWHCRIAAQEMEGVRQAITNVFLRAHEEGWRSPTIDELETLFGLLTREPTDPFYICGRIFYTGRRPTQEEWERDVEIQKEILRSFGRKWDAREEARVRQWVWHTFRQRKMEWWRVYVRGREFRMDVYEDTNAGPARCDFEPLRTVVQTNGADGRLRTLTVNYDVRTATVRPYRSERPRILDVFRTPDEWVIFAGAWLGKPDVLKEQQRLEFDADRARAGIEGRLPFGRLEAREAKLGENNVVVIRPRVMLHALPFEFLKNLRPELQVAIYVQDQPRLMGTFVGTAGRWKARVYEYSDEADVPSRMGEVSAEAGKELEVVTYYVDEYRVETAFDPTIFIVTTPPDWLVVERNTNGEVYKVLQAGPYTDVSRLTMGAKRAAGDQGMTPFVRRLVRFILVASTVGMLAYAVRSLARQVRARRG